MDILFLLLLDAPGEGGIAMEAEVDAVEEELPKARGFSISTNDFLLDGGEGGAPALSESPMLAICGLKPVSFA